MRNVKHGLQRAICELPVVVSDRLAHTCQKIIEDPTLKPPSGQALPKRKIRVNELSFDRPYPDLHDHLKALDQAGLLITVTRPINKDTEMHPLVRWQFRGGIEEKDRRAFLFTNAIDNKGRSYDIPVVIGALAANREIYRLGMRCELDEINEVWHRALSKPIPPQVVTNAKHLASQARIHGTCKTDLGRIGPAESEAGGALVRVFAW